MPDKNPPDQTTSSTFASRQADREAREAAGETPPERVPRSFRAGVDADPTPPLVVRRVRA